MNRCDKKQRGNIIKDKNNDIGDDDDDDSDDDILIVTMETIATIQRRRTKWGNFNLLCNIFNDV